MHVPPDLALLTFLPELAAAMEECSPEQLSQAIRIMEDNEEKEAARLPVDELMRRAREYHSGVSETYTSITKHRSMRGEGHKHGT